LLRWSAYVRQTQGIGIGMFLIVLLGFLRLRMLSQWLHVLLSVEFPRIYLGAEAAGYGEMECS